ncbi:MAG: endonuclease MutS2 [Armatimonadota bacterium]|nr:endonuclease MutS2 [Armatimonadota bacterium]
MDSHTLEVLEYPNIIERLCATCACSLGRGRAERLKPNTDPEWVRTRLSETAQARIALQEFGRPPFGGVTDVSEMLERAAAGRGLEGQEILRVTANARAARLVADYFEAAREEAPDVADFSQRLGLYEDLEERVERAIDEEGEVRDDASDELVRLRRREEDLRETLHERLERILDSAAQSGAARERLIVQRSGRYCIPVDSQHQSRVPGIVHDRSDSGATVFIEPQELVDLGNRLRDTELAIKEEVRRILMELSQLIGALASSLEADQRTLGVLDFICAKARLAQRMDATNPVVREDRVFSLRGARHPLLTPEEVVPITVWGGEAFDTLIITGPNTGGKTVALKTVGLLTLMAQAGMHIPADPGSEVSVFEEVFADIGDEQSIEQSLSTFSSHMTQIVKVLHRVAAHERRHRRKGVDAPVNALVLLDEIGAGTDPTEGAALAQAVIEQLHATGCITVVTTHYNDLKAFAYATDGIENASVEFDVKTLQPTYHLRIGAAGSSNALEIAQRLGLPRTITGRASEFLDPDQMAFEDLIRQVEGSRRAMDREQSQAREARAEAERLQREHEQRIEELERQRDEALEEGFEEALEIVREAEEEARGIIARLQRQPRQSKVTEEGRQRLAEMRREAQRRLQELRRERQERQRRREREEAAVEEEASPEPEVFEVYAGDRVHVPSLGRDGEVVQASDDGQVEVRVGNMTVETRAEELKPAQTQPSPEAQEIHQRMRAKKSLSFDDEIDLRGMTVDEAITALSKYLDDAMLAGADHVRIIHGKGTGALREGVHEYLRKHRYVSDFSLAEIGEGGSGATEVRL